MDNLKYSNVATYFDDKNRVSEVHFCVVIGLFDATVHVYSFPACVCV